MQVLREETTLGLKKTKTVAGWKLGDDCYLFQLLKATER